MSHFARVTSDGTVSEVISAEQDFIDTGVLGNPQEWVQCSYNTRAGVHLTGGTPIRKNFPAAGFTYDSVRDAFIPPKPSGITAWVLDENTCCWVPPKAKPTDGYYLWDEATQNWDRKGDK